LELRVARVTLDDGRGGKVSAAIAGETGVTLLSASRARLRSLK
jgi:hypothetical protein